MAKTTREERLKMCGTEIWRVDPQTSALSVIPSRCKLPECPVCQQLKRERTYKDLKEAQKDFGGLKFGRNLDVTALSGPYMKIPLMDGSTVVFCTEQASLDLQEVSDEALWGIDLAEYVVGKRRSGALINYRKKKRRRELVEGGWALEIERRSIVIENYEDQERARALYEKARIYVLEHDGGLFVEGERVQALVKKIERQYQLLLDLDQIDYRELGKPKKVLLDSRQVKWNIPQLISIYNNQYREANEGILEKTKKKWDIDRFFA